QRISEIRSEPVLNTIAFDMNKTFVAFMMSEMISRTVKESEVNKNLFGFLFDAVVQLDGEQDADSFHLSFLLHLSSHLGFFPLDNFSSDTRCFNLKDGLFQRQQPAHPHWLDIELSECFFSLIKTPLVRCGELKFSSAIKKNLLSALVMYFRLHVEGFMGIRSQKILEEVWMDG
ncbi:MAG: DNA repair protein RecO C-terminal domain-containing protein, partial [Bacteroidia bacterium]|nr:DNA repair protein RecO C-terminal domain-containing protein [Bacteroidia bacterium]